MMRRMVGCQKGLEKGVKDGSGIGVASADGRLAGVAEELVRSRV